MTCPRTFKPVLSVIRFERQLSLLESGKQNIFHGHFYTPTCRPLKAPVVWAFKAHFAQCSSRRHSCLTNVQQCDVRGRGRESLNGRPPAAPPFAPRGYPNARAPSSVRPSLAVAEGGRLTCAYGTLRSLRRDGRRRTRTELLLCGRISWVG